MDVPASLPLVHAILQAVLAPSNADRKAQEQKLATMREEQPEELIKSLICILRQAPEGHLRALAAVLLRQILTALSIAAPALWSSLLPEVQNTVKTELLAVLLAEPEKTVRKRVADTVGELGATVLGGETEEGWAELLPFVFAFTANDQQLISALQILASLSTYVHSRLLAHKSDLWRLFTMGLQSANSDTALAAVTTICGFLSIVKTSDAMEFSSFLMPLLQVAFKAAKEGEAEGREALEALLDLAEAEPHFFAQQFDTMVSFLTDIFGLETGLGVKSLTVEMVVSLVERKPKLIRGNEGRCKVLLEKVFLLMVSVDAEVEESWSRPPEGFQDKDDAEEIEIDYAQTGRKCISRLMESVGDEHLFPFLTSAVQTLLANEADWRMKYSALMTISELGQYVEEESKLGELVRILLPHTGLQYHPKVRYAAYHALGQLCEDQGDDVRSAFHQPLARALLSGLEDPVPRVLSHCAAAVANFFEDASSDLINPYLAPFTEKLVSLISKSRPSIVVEYSITALAALAEVAGERFAQYYPPLLQLLMDVVTGYSEPVYKQLRGRTIECISILCVSVGKATYMPQLGLVVGLFRKIQEQELAAADPQTNYLLTAWQRLCSDLKSDFAVCLPEVIPGLLAMAQVKALASTAMAPESAFNLEEIAQVSNRSKSINVNTAELEDKKTALETLLTIMEMMKGSYLPFVQETVSLCLPLVAYTINEDIRVAAAGCLGAALRTVQLSGLGNAEMQTIALARLIFPAIWEALDREFDADASISQLQTLQALVETPNKTFLSQVEVQTISEGVIKLLDRTLNEKSPADTQDSDSEEGDELTSIRKVEESRLHNAIAGVFTALFKTHTVEALPVVSYFLTTKLPLLLDPNGKDDNVKFALFIVDDIVEFIGPERLGEIWMQLKDPLLSHLSASGPEVRQAACYGLGVFAQRCPADLFTPLASQAVSALMRAAESTSGKGNPSYHSARDNAVSAIGKVLKFHSSAVTLSEVVPYWINHLPLKHDKAEARLMHALLADFLVQNQQDLLDQRAFLGLLPKIVHILGTVLETKFVLEDFAGKVKAFLLGLRGRGGSEVLEIWAGLSDTQKSKIARLVDGANSS